MRSFLAIESPRKGRQPGTLELVVASVASIAGSLLICAVLLLVTTHWFPAASKYPPFEHFRYFTLTVVVAAAACAAWPVCTFFSSRARRLYLCVMVGAVLLTIAIGTGNQVGHEPAVIAGILVMLPIAVALVVTLCLLLLSPQWPRPEPRSWWFEPPRAA